ncbi:MAG: hypothetical protein H0T51_14465 [Pirellulales bacterium]|nr:hypothetical protein [Pirellulales bacterium]
MKLTSRMILILLATTCGLHQSLAVNLVDNGDFETIVTEEDVPALDAYGLQRAAAWFRAGSSPQDYTTPVTELINPANMNNAAGNNLGDDSDGNGNSSAALNFTTEPGGTLGLASDWRTRAIDTVPGETLIYSMDFKFIGVSPDDEVFGGFFNGLFAQVRSFAGEAADGGTQDPFVGERNVPVQYRANYAPDVWHTVRDRVVIPAGGEFTDIRISVNTFDPAWLFNGQILIDNIQLIRLSADFDDDLDVDGADLAIWKSGFATNATGDADADGVTDGTDFLIWQRELGLVVPPELPPVPKPTAIAAVGAVPEPAGLPLAVSSLAAAALFRRKR